MLATAAGRLRVEAADPPVMLLDAGRLRAQTGGSPALRVAGRLTVDAGRLNTAFWLLMKRALTSLYGTHPFFRLSVALSIFRERCLLTLPQIGHQAFQLRIGIHTTKVIVQPASKRRISWRAFAIPQHENRHVELEASKYSSCTAIWIGHGS